MINRNSSSENLESSWKSDACRGHECLCKLSWKLYICLISCPLNFNITVFTSFIRYDVDARGYWYFHRESAAAMEARTCVHVRARAGGSRFLNTRARLVLKAKVSRAWPSGKKREICVNVRNSGFAVREFKRVLYNGNAAQYRSKRVA